MGIRVKGQAIVAFERTLAEIRGPEAMAALSPHLTPELLQNIKRLL